VAAPRGSATKPVALPGRIMLDSGVIIRALEHANPQRSSDPRVADCRALWERALSECRVFLPPFVVLEVMSGEQAGALPIVKSIEHVAFTYQVAESMAKWAKPGDQKRVAKDTKSNVALWLTTH
jgi:glutathione S-transferase